MYPVVIAIVNWILLCVFFKCSNEGFVQLRNIIFTYVVIIEYNCLCRILWYFLWGGGSKGVSPRV